MPNPRVARLAVVLVAACSSDPAPDRTGTGVVLIGGSGCSPSVCGDLNPMLLDCAYFSRLSSTGLPNDHGVKIVSVVRADGTAMRLIAELDRLRGVHPVTGAALADHEALVGTVITVSVADSLQHIVIDRVTAQGAHFWVGAQSSIETYDLSYTVPGVSGPPVTMLRVIAFTGDSYDPISKQVTIGTRGWINFACPGSITAKMHLIGHTSAAAQRLGITTTLAKRQSVLNAFTMNACGTGVVFTSASEPITLSESQHLLPPTSPLQAPRVTVEAIWGPDGAVCLDVPRLANSAAMVGVMANAIEAECGAALPSCSALIADWPAYGSALTGNPAGSSP
jgi:hypothetical protein